MVHVGVHWLIVVVVYLTEYVADVAGHVVTSDSIAGFHCGNATIIHVQNSSESANETSYHYHCVQCLFYHNCLPNNTCRLGTYGETCEKCVRGEKVMEGWVRVGNSCTPCPTVPWSLVSFGVYLLLVCFSFFYNGFTESLATKMKLLCHYLQLLSLTFHIKVPWPDTLLQCLVIINFSAFNLKLGIPECSLPQLPVLYTYLVEWCSTLLIASLVIILGLVLDRSMTRMISDDQSDETVMWQHRRGILRRFVYFVIIVKYMPIATSAMNSFMCKDNVPAELVLRDNEDIFLLDNDIDCSGILFQVVHLWAVIFLLTVVLLFPLLIVFFTLRQKKWDFLHSQKHLYGHVYESYKDTWCFWDAVPLLRKLVCIIATDTYPISPFLQSVIQLSMSGLYLVTVVVFRPYRHHFWAKEFISIHIVFELLGAKYGRAYVIALVALMELVSGNVKVLSSMVLCLIQTIPLLNTFDLYFKELETVSLICIPGVLAVWIVLMLALPCESTKETSLTKIVTVEAGPSTSNPQEVQEMEEFQEQSLREETKKQTVQEVKKKEKKRISFFGKNKVEPAYQKTIEQRRKVLDF